MTPTRSLPNMLFRQPLGQVIACGDARAACWLGIMIVVCLSSMARAADGPARPNILFILADDLGYGDLGCYGQQRIRTPNIDRLAADGLRFTDCYAGCTVCAPSRCALMTGMHSGHGRVRGNKFTDLHADDATIAERLHAAGYATALVGKWGLGAADSAGAPNRKGFDEFFGFLDQRHAHNYYPDHLWRNAERYPLEGNVLIKENVAGQKAQYAPDLFTREALAFLDRRAGQSQPFFLYLAYTLPHANNERGAFDGNGMEVPDDAPYSSEPWPAPQKNHAAMITRLDADVGRVLDRLKELNLDDQTIVFFTSDNGPHKEGGGDPAFFGSSGRLRGWKRDLSEGGIRVPMIARWPQHIKPGSVSTLPWAFWDFPATAAELAGARPPQDDGLSVLPTLLSSPNVMTHRFLYWEFHERGFQQAVRMGDWKAIRTKPGHPLELYQLATDPGEATNLADRYPLVVAEIEEYLKTARVDSPHYPITPPR